MDEQDKLEVISWVKSLAAADVKLVCLDFDLTLINMHTGGRWWGGAKTLARNIRPIFQIMIPEALRGGIEVCVVTMTRQTALVADVLKNGLPCDVSRIEIRGGEHGMLVNQVGEAEKVCFEGSHKRRHINSILHARRERNGDELAPQQILLVDDDIFNVEEARGSKNRAVVFNPDDPMEVVSSLHSTN